MGRNPKLKARCTVYFLSFFTMFFMSGFLGSGFSLTNGPLTPVLASSLRADHRYREVYNAVFFYYQVEFMGITYSRSRHTLNLGKPFVFISLIALKRSVLCSAELRMYF